MSDTKLEADLVVQSVKRCLRQGVHGLETLPDLLRRVIKEDLWRERRLEKSGDVVRFETFREFVETSPPEGLGSKVATLEAVCRNDTEVLDLIDRASRQSPGRSKAPTVYNVHSSRPSGNARTAALRRLRSGRPDLHKKVLAGKMSPYAAMREAGFRQRTMTVPADIPDLAKTLKKRLNKSQVERLVAALNGNGSRPKARRAK